MIVVSNLSKYYFLNGKNNCIFKNLNFSIGSKESVALIGKNGAGKSTLLRLLAGIDIPDSGEIRTNKKISWPIGSRDNFNPSLSARENIIFICRVFLGKDYDRISEKIKFVEDFANINSYFDKPFKFYSSGMKARVAFGLSMSFDFDFYLIDEVTSAGDESFRNKSKILLEEKMSNSSFIMVDHNLGNLKKYCNKALLITNNSIVEFNDVDEAIEIHKKMQLKG